MTVHLQIWSIGFALDKHNMKAENIVDEMWAIGQELAEIEDTKILFWKHDICPKRNMSIKVGLGEFRE